MMRGTAIVTATVTMFFVVVMTSVVRVKAGVYPEAPNADGSCNEGWAITPIGCCPLGTENVHNFCESPEEHNQATNNYLACLAAEALKGITGTQAMSDCINGGS